MGCFITSVFGLVGIVSLFYPDKPSAPRTFKDGLETELGGPNALRVSLPNAEVADRFQTY